MDAPSTQQHSGMVQSDSSTEVLPSTQVAVQPQSPKISYRANLLQRAQAQIPLTTEGLPVGYYRIDLLPNTRPEKAEEELQALRNAHVDLSFEHGYPTQPDGRPFWYKLDFEPGFAYGAFEIYLECIDRGPRELFALSENAELRHLATRMYLSQAELEALPASDKLIPKERLHKHIYEFSILYNWRQRSKAHDLYKDAASRHLRLRRQTTTEDRHYEMATKLMKELHEKVIDSGSTFWDGMSAKTAVDLLGKLVAIERISVGLPAQGPLATKEQPQDMTFEMIMRTLGQKTSQGNVYENGGAPSPGRQILADALRDPEVASNLQEMIIRITKSTHQPLPDPSVGARARSFKGRGRNVEIITDDDLVPYDVSGAPGENLDTGSSEVEVPK